MSDNQKLTIVGLILLGVGFVATTIGSILVITAPYGGGVNIPVGFLYQTGMAIGVIGLAISIVALIGMARRKR